MTRSTALFVSTLSTMLFVYPGGHGDEDSPPRIGSNTPLHCVLCISPPGPGGPGVKDGDVSKNTDANAPGDALVMSIGYREIATETLDELCMSRVNPRSRLKMCDELSHSVLCDVGVIALGGGGWLGSIAGPGMCLGSVSGFCTESGPKFDLSLVRSSELF